MAINNVVTGPNLGPEFLIGTGVDPTKVEIKVDGTSVLRAADGTLSSPTVAETLTVLAYNNATTTLTYTDENGNDTAIDLAALAADIFVDGATFNATTGVLTLTDNDAGTPDVTVDLSAFQGVSADAGNLLSDGADGKPFFDSAAFCTAMDDCTDPCEVRDIFGNLIGTVLMDQP